MKAPFFKITVIMLVLSSQAFAQTATENRWKKAVVKTETILQRYNQPQIDVLLQKKLDSIGKVISQHETFEIRDNIEAIKDTIRGTGVIIADGTKLYLVTAKHLIKTTEKLRDGSETVSDLFTIRTDAGDKRTNDISLQNLFAYSLHARPFVFSDDKTDLAVISLQKNSYKAIVAYMKANGLMPVPIQDITNVTNTAEVFTVGFPALHHSIQSEVSTGKIKSISASSFIADLAVYPGNSGGPVIMNNKLLGILSYQNGFTSNIDVALHPYEKANSATVIKVSQILPLLRKLQLNEKDQAFNKPY